MSAFYRLTALALAATVALGSTRPGAVLRDEEGEVEKVIEIYDNIDDFPLPVPGESVSFTKGSVSLKRGMTFDLSRLVTAAPSLADIIWSSADPGVAAIDERGVITGNSIGSCWVTARVGTAEAGIYVYVDKNDMVTDPFEFMYMLKVNRSFNCITAYIRDDAGEFTVPVRAFRCSTGKLTPYGTQRIHNHNAWNGLYGNYDGMWSSWIISDFLFHSVPFYSRTHDSLVESMYNDLGTSCSGGCVRLQVINAKWIFDNCPVGTSIYFYFDDTDPGPLGLPDAIDITPGLGWDPTDPDPANPWFSGQPQISGVHDINTTTGSLIDLLEGVNGTDSAGNAVTDLIKVSTLLNANMPGEYRVAYTLTDAAYRTTHAYCTVTVTGDPVIAPAEPDTPADTQAGVDTDTPVDAGSGPDAAAP